mgnify:CR=1 FL=1
MESISVHLRDVSPANAKDGLPKLPKLKPGARFAELKEIWAAQVAEDRGLSETALRIALVLPRWLNSKTLKAWPSQRTIAGAINTSDRAVRDGLKKLVDSGHLHCLTEKPGGRMSNVYRIVVHGGVICESDCPGTGPAGAQPGTPLPGRSEGSRRGVGNAGSGQPGHPVPVSAAGAFRGTPERTPERTQERVAAPELAEGDATHVRGGRRLTAESAERLMRETFGEARVGPGGYFRGED